MAITNPQQRTEAIDRLKQLDTQLTPAWTRLPGDPDPVRQERQALIKSILDFDEAVKGPQPKPRLWSRNPVLYSDEWFDQRRALKGDLAEPV